MFKAHRLLYHSTLGLRVIKKKKEVWGSGLGASGSGIRVVGVGVGVECGVFSVERVVLSL